MDKCKNFDKNMEYCTCDYEPCPRKGFCCECIRYHIKNGGEPACMKQ